MFRKLSIAVLLAALAALAGAGCNDENNPTAPNSGTFVGDAKPVGNGTGRAWVRLDAGRPTAVGVTLTANALTGLDADDYEVTLTLPSQAAATPYNHVYLNWNPAGHPPDSIYTPPHFDVHFYTVTDAVRRAYVGGPDPTAIRPPSDAGYIPEDYVPDSASVPGMGLHWIDPSAEEWQPPVHGFNRTFIFGSYDGTFVFWEPMVTIAYLQSLAAGPLAETITFKQPAKFPIPGRYYPVQYSVLYDPGAQEYTIALEFLVRRNQ